MTTAPQLEPLVISFPLLWALLRLWAMRGILLVGVLGCLLACNTVADWSNHVSKHRFVDYREEEVAPINTRMGIRSCSECTGESSKCCKDMNGVPRQCYPEGPGWTCCADGFAVLLTSPTQAEYGECCRVSLSGSWAQATAAFCPPHPNSPYKYCYGSNGGCSAKPFAMEMQEERNEILKQEHLEGYWP